MIGEFFVEVIARGWVIIGGKPALYQTLKDLLPVPHLSTVTDLSQSEAV